MPRFSGDLGFHRESLSEEVKIKTDPGIEAPAAQESSQTRKDEGFRDRQILWRGFDDNKIKEEDRSHDLEEKLQFPPEAPSEATAARTVKREPQVESPRGIPNDFVLYYMNHQR